MDYGKLLKSLPSKNEKYQYVYIVDLGNGNSEVGHTDDLKATFYRYLTTEQTQPKSIWLSREFSSEPKPENPVTAEFVGLELDDWQIAFGQLMEFAHRAAVNAVTETRFFMLPAPVLVSWATYCKLGPGRETLFTEGR